VRYLRSLSTSQPYPIFSDIKSPIIIQVSQGGAAYFAGKGLANDKQQASITGAIAAALHVRTVAKEYGVYVRSLSGR
jgi:fructose/tagatose bisphosphate aldolase